MQHFLLTRFNLKIEGSSNNGLDANWLTNRFSIFKEFCLPSVLNQSNTNFTWIIFFDKDTPKVFKEKALELEANYRLIKVLFIDGFKELNNDCAKLIKPFITENFIITTRLDNDDAIHKDFINTIQNLATLKHNQIIDIRKGYQVSKKEKTYIFKLLKNKFNPFISIVEKTDDYKTILSKMHTSWRNEKDIIVYNGKRLWIEFIHGENLANRTKKYVPATKNIDFKNFSLLPLAPTSSKGIIVLSNFIKSPLFLAFKFYKTIWFNLIKQWLSRRS